MTGAAILGVVYGVDVQPTGDPLIELVEKAMDIFSTVISPGSFIGTPSVELIRLNFVDLQVYSGQPPPP